MTFAESRQNRREFLRTVARYGALGGLGFLGGYLALRDSPTVEGQACISAGACRGCGVLDRCDLPAAVSAKSGLGR